MIRVVLNGGGRMAESIRDVASQGVGNPGAPGSGNETSGVGAPDDRIPGVVIVGVASPNRPEWLGSEAWAERLDGLDAAADLIIDFSLPEGTVMAADWCSRNGVPLLSGVTGLAEEHFAALERAAEHVPVLWAPNLSLGVNLLESLLRIVARTLDPAVPVRIHDVHHQWKKDAPSGTALALGEAVESTRSPESPPVEYSSDREGEVVGLHRVRFEMDGEVLELSHEALDRAIFARGALEAARWLRGQSPGRYGAADWLAGRS